MKVDLRDKTNDQQIMTDYHSFYFGHSEAPKELDLFNVPTKNVQSIILGSRTVNKGFWRAMRSFVKNYKRVAVELSKEEYELVKEFEPEVYELYIKYHKGRFNEDKIIDEPVALPFGDVVKKVHSKKK